MMSQISVGAEGTNFVTVALLRFYTENVPPMNVLRFEIHRLCKC